MRIGIPRLPPLTPSSDSLSSSSPYHHLHNISHDLWPEGQSPCQLKLISLWSLVTARKHESHQRGGFFLQQRMVFTRKNISTPIARSGHLIKQKNQMKIWVWPFYGVRVCRQRRTSRDQQLEGSRIEQSPGIMQNSIYMSLHYIGSL